MGIKDKFKAFRERVKDKALIRQQDEEIKRLNNTIDNMNENHDSYFTKQDQQHDKNLTAKESEIKSRYDAQLTRKDIYINHMKKKMENYDTLSDAVVVMVTEIEKLRYQVKESHALAESHAQQTVSWIGSVGDGIDAFLRKFKKFQKSESKTLLKIEG